MNVYSLLPDPKLIELFEAIMDSGGIIHGGFLRDLFFYGKHNVFKDIDIYYDHNSNLAKSVKIFNSTIIENLTDVIRKKPSFKNLKNAIWLDSPLDDYGDELSHCEVGIPCAGYYCADENEDEEFYKNLIPLDLIYRPAEFSVKNNFLDFDIHSLYLLPDGTITSSLGSDKVDKIINNIKEGQCKLMRSDVSNDRIKHILDNGFSCNLVPFL